MCECACGRFARCANEACTESECPECRERKEEAENQRTLDEMFPIDPRD
jgi:hypothetical protein